MVLWGGVFKRRLGQKGGVLVIGIGALIEETPDSSQTPFHPVRTQWDAAVCSRAGGLRWSPAPVSTWSQTSRLQNCAQYVSVAYKPPSLWLVSQPEQSQTLAPGHPQLTKPHSEVPTRAWQQSPSRQLRSPTHLSSNVGVILERQTGLIQSHSLYHLGQWGAIFRKWEKLLKEMWTWCQMRNQSALFSNLRGTTLWTPSPGETSLETASNFSASQPCGENTVHC